MMNFSSAVLTGALVFLLGSAEAFLVPRPHVRIPRSALSAGDPGEALKRGIKFLLVPNAKQPAPSASAPIPFKDIPDITPVTPSAPVPPPVAAAITPPPAPPVVVTPPPPAPAAIVQTPPPPPVVPQQAAAATTPPETPADVWHSIFRPLPGMNVIDQSVEDSYRPNVAPPHSGGPAKIDWDAFASRWNIPDGGFDWATWWQHKYDDAWHTTGPVNTGPPKMVEMVIANQDSNQFAYRGLQTLEQTSQQLTASWLIFRTSVVELTALTTSGQPYTQAEFEKALNLQATSGWYVAIMGTLATMWWNSVSGDGTGTATRTMSPTTNLRGGMAVNEAHEAKLNAVSKADKDIEKREAMVADQVSQLTEATRAVTEQLAELQSAKAQRDYDVATMKSDLRELRNELYMTQRSEQNTRQSLEKTQAQLEAETKSLREQLEERIEAEAAVRKQLQDTKDRMAVEMQTISAAKNQAEKQVVQAKAQVSALEKEKQAMENQITTLKAQVQELKAKLETPAPVTSKATAESAVKGAKAAVPPVSPPVVEKVAAATKTPTKKIAKKAAAKKKIAKTSKVVDTERDALESLSNAFFANITEPVGSAATSNSTPSKVAKKMSSPKTITVKKASKSPAAVTEKAAPEAPGLDWSNMSHSALKRKTVKDLQQYLSTQVPVRISIAFVQSGVY